jgi:hypothetical protein
LKIEKGRTEYGGRNTEDGGKEKREKGAGEKRSRGEKEQGRTEKCNC